MKMPYGIPDSAARETGRTQSVDVAAYIWPAYTGTEPRARIFWEEGEGEWQTVRRAAPKFPGHPWPRRPLWGYVDEADPHVMERQIETALAYGVNVFIYDWYWYDGRPFLEQCLDNGFLGASNSRSMRFYLMWANHDAKYLWDRRNSADGETVVWRGKVTPEDFEVIGRRWLEQYFGLENYYRIDGRPVIAIYDIRNFVDSFGGLEQTAGAMRRLHDRARQSGLAGVHFQLIDCGEKNTGLTGVDGEPGMPVREICRQLPFSSVTHYQFVHFVDVDRTYDAVLPDVEAAWARSAGESGLLYLPHVSIGWDNNPRFEALRPKILRDNTPEAFGRAMRHAVAAAKATGAPMVTVNSWNEWTEGSYLEPDDRNGYGYLEAVRQAVLE